MAKQAHERYRQASDFYREFQAALDTPATNTQTNQLLNSILNVVVAQMQITPPTQPFSTKHSEQPHPSTSTAGNNRNEKSSSQSKAPAAVASNLPQTSNQPHLYSQLDHLHDLLAKAEGWHEWDSVIELSSLILKLDKTDEAVMNRAIHAHRQRAFGALRRGAYRHAFADLMAVIKLGPHAQQNGLVRMAIVVYDFVVAANAVMKALQPPPSAHLGEQPDAANTPAPLDPADTRVTADFNQAVELAPQRSEPYFERGRYYASKRQYTQAIQDFTQALELESDSFLKTWYYRERGTVFEFLGNHRAARRDFQEAAKYRRVAASF
jgi:tetratricopeptide (TPR) repeat protein